MSDTWPRVSTILKDMGLVKPYPEGVPAVEWGRARGTAVHLAIRYLEEGCLDETTLHPDVRGPVRAYQAFKRETGYQPEAFEEAVAHAGLRFRGTLDSRGALGRMPTILDFKCSKQPDLTAAAYQLAGYSVALAHTINSTAPRYVHESSLLWGGKALVIQLGDESYRVHDVTSLEAADIFEAAVKVWWARTEGLPKLARNGSAP